MKKLVLIEGLCGTGKTTLGGRLRDALAAEGIACRFYDEGAADHPVSLNGYAYLTEADFAGLQRAYEGFSQRLSDAVLWDDGYALVPYARMDGLPDALRQTLAAREFSWRKTPLVPVEVFTKALRKRWQHFAQALPPGVTILEGVFFQHPIHDLTRLYAATTEAIRQFLLRTAEALPPADTVLLYLSHADVAAQQRWIARVRDRAHYADEDSIRRMQARKGIEQDVLARLPFEAAVITCAPPAWEDAYMAAYRTVWEG